MPLKLLIENFKSVERLELGLDDLTVLIGPPASGKSNILDAIAVVGYFHRFKVLDREYGNSASNLEPLTMIGRFADIPQLARYSDISRPVRICISGDVNIDFSISYVSGAPRISINEKQAPWDLKTLRSDSMGEVQSFVKTLPPLESRLYGFDRYGLGIQTCAQPHPCGLQYRLAQLQYARSYPVSILSDFGWNAPHMVRMHRDVINEVDDAIERYIGAKIEVVARRTGEVLILDYRHEVESQSVSESIYRTLYSLLAIKSSVYYAKLYGLEKKLIVMLEEPEAHVFPYLLELLVEYIARAVNVVNIVITTHNPFFVSRLCDKVKNAKVYYVHRVLSGTTSVKELDFRKLSEEVLTIEDVLLMKPSDVLEKYVVEASEGEAVGERSGSAS
jgi:hypothetical protein